MEKEKVFLGGTCADSKWRNKLIPLLNIDYFNPVVENWTQECMTEEIQQREKCNYVLYTLTRTYSTYSIAEVVDDSNKRPEKTICCIFNEELSNGKKALSSQDLKHLNEVGNMVERNGGKYFKSLENVAEYLNEKKERVFLWDKEETIKIGNQLDFNTVLEFMNHYDVDEFEARCSIAEMYLSQEEDRQIYQLAEERIAQDNGNGHSLHEVKLMTDKNRKGNI